MDRFRAPLLSTLKWLLPCAILLCGGCGLINRDSWRATQAVFNRKSHSRPSAEFVGKSPYALLQVDYAGSSATLTLGYVDDDGLLSWYSHDRKIVYLRSDGLLAGSHGLPTDAADIRLEGGNPFAQLARTRQATTTSREYDWMPGYRYGIKVTGQLQVVGNESVQFPDTARDLLHVRERLRGPGIKADNDYWIDPQTGFIWKSRQLLAPGVMLGLTQLKPYRPAGVQ